MINKLAAAIVFVTAAMAIAPTATASVIDYPGGDDISYWGPSAIGGGQSYGEIFAAPQAVLDDYTLTVRYSDTSFPFVSQIYAWDGTGLVGPALYTSAPLATTADYTTYIFATALSLTPGNLYIALVTNQPFGISMGGSGFGQMEANFDPGISNFRFAEGDPTAGAWFTYSGNARFHAEFSDASAAVPEPAAIALCAIALLSLLGFGMMRRRADA